MEQNNTQKGGVVAGRIYLRTAYAVLFAVFALGFGLGSLVGEYLTNREAETKLAEVAQAAAMRLADDREARKAFERVEAVLAQMEERAARESARLPAIPGMVVTPGIYAVPGTEPKPYSLTPGLWPSAFDTNIITTPNTVTNAGKQSHVELLEEMAKDSSRYWNDYNVKGEGSHLPIYNDAFKGEKAR